MNADVCKQIIIRTDLRGKFNWHEEIVPKKIL